MSLSSWTMVRWMALTLCVTSDPNNMALAFVIRPTPVVNSPIIPSSWTSSTFPSFSTTTTPLTTVESSKLSLAKDDYINNIDNQDLDGSNSSSGRRRKRDIIRKLGSNTKHTLLGGARRYRYLLSSTTQLDMAKSDNNDDNKDEKNQFQLQYEILKTKVTSRIPTKLLALLESIITNLRNAAGSIQIALISFVTGAILALAAILVPIYSQVESLTEPVTLFETILSDLDRGYVDQVDTNKLFETGVSAMLRSLDPYTEFETKQEATALTESIGGKYAGVGLVISGAQPKDLSLLQEIENGSSNNNNNNNGASAPSSSGSKLLPQDALNDQQKLQENETPMPTSADGDITSSSTSSPQMQFVDEQDDDDDDYDTTAMSMEEKLEQKRFMKQLQDRGITVVSAFEGYAFDYGMRVGDKLVAVDDKDITKSTTVDQVRNMLRGEPDTMVSISFEREGLDGVQTIRMPRQVVQINDVKLTTFVGDPKDGIGYIQLSGFAANAGQEVKRSILALQYAAEEASNGEASLKGLILDLRGNPGGLLTSAVDVASLLVPKNSDIVSAKGRGFPGVLYRSRVDPIVDPTQTKLAVLVNGGTASAAEIVSGAIQDLDVGVIVGQDRTFGKGLVQNVEDLPFNTALKFTVAKYYTPSGRCIQSVNYKEGGGLKESDGKYKASKVADKDKHVYYTRLGREIKDGGGIEVDYKVGVPKASALEVTLLRSNIFSDYAAQWSRTHELTNNFQVDDDTYRNFQAFVNEKQKSGDIKLEALYNKPLLDLKNALSKSGYKGSTKELEQLQSTIVREVQKDFDKYKTDIKEDIAQSILARYVPESMLLERSIKSDKQVLEATKLISNSKQFDTLLARGSDAENKNKNDMNGATTLSTASSSVADQDKENSAKLNIKW